MDQFKSIVMTPRIYDYLLRQAPPPSPVQAALIARTAELGEAAEMQIPHEQAVFLTLLAKLVNAGTIVEVGTFTGYSTLALALGLAPGGRVITCDISDKWAAIAEGAWSQAGVDDRIEPRLGPAAATLRELPEAADIALGFLDPDKPGYLDYWDQLVPRVRPGGLLPADNGLH